MRVLGDVVMDACDVLIEREKGKHFGFSARGISRCSIQVAGREKRNLYLLHSIEIKPL